MHEDVHVLRQRIFYGECITPAYKEEARVHSKKPNSTHGNGGNGQLDYPRLDSHIAPSPTGDQDAPESVPYKQYQCSPTRMVRHRELRILQYNVPKSRDIVLASLFSNPKITEYDIIAIQEPWRNRFINTSYHPLKGYFQLTYLDDRSTRVCFYINKQIDRSTWNVTYISKDIIFISIRNPRTNRKIRIFDIYNEVGTKTLSTLSESLGKLDSHAEIIVLGGL